MNREIKFRAWDGEKMQLDRRNVCSIYPGTDMIRFLPFIIELIADWQLIKAGKKDIPLWLRVVLIGLCSSETFWVLTVPVSNLCLACAPFFFFDNLLAWLRKKRGFDYQGQTKPYDKWIARFNPYALMVFRCVGFGVLVAGYFVLKNYGLPGKK